VKKFLLNACFSYFWWKLVPTSSPSGTDLQIIESLFQRFSDLTAMQFVFRFMVLKNFFLLEGYKVFNQCQKEAFQTKLSLEIRNAEICMIFGANGNNASIQKQFIHKL
jgi:hypothetical protein